MALAGTPTGAAHLDYESRSLAKGSVETPTSGFLAKKLVWLALPVLGENLLHTLVGLNDTYLANHIGPDTAASTAAVGTVMYFFWFIGLFSSSIGVGATALISRATGAKHRRQASAACGQAILFALIFGTLLGLMFFLFAQQIARLTQLPESAAVLAADYFRYLSPAIPAVVVLAVANACLRGAGDTLRPALAMAVVGVLTVVCTQVMVNGYFGLPKVGFVGLALGTAGPYLLGAALQCFVLFGGTPKLRLYWHRLRPNFKVLERLLRVGVPAATENLLMWSANFILLGTINSLDATSASAAAHSNAIRLEALSFMSGFAVSIAAASLVGQRLGAKDPLGAKRVGYIAFAIGGSIMTLMGLVYSIFPHTVAGVLASDARVTELTAACLFIAGFCQPGFAAAIVFGGALRGAGDTFVVMLMTLLSIGFVRVCGVLIITHVYGGMLEAVWIVLAIDLTVRGILAYSRFASGAWAKVKV